MLKKSVVKRSALPLGDLEILDQREVPVLLARAAERVASQVAEAGGAEVGIREDRRIRLVRIALASDTAAAPA